MAGKEQLTAQQIIDAIPGTGGIMAAVARKLGVHRATISNYAKRYVTVRRALDDADEGLTDVAEGKAFERIKEGYWPAIRYRLNTKGKDRGYTERVDITTKGEKLETNIIILPTKESE